MASLSTVAIVNGGFVPFGGSRLRGVSQVMLWNDHVVMATAWEESGTGLRTGEVHEFRGSIKRGNGWGVSTRRWVLRDVADVYLADYASRKDAVDAARRLAEVEVFRALNKREAAAQPCPSCGQVPVAR